MGSNYVKPRRRAFLGAGIAAAAGAAVFSARSQGAGAWRFFTDAEAKTVDAICAQLIPEDQDPGAHEAGVVNYIDIQLTRAFKKHQDAYRKGIAAVDTASRAKFGKPFASLSSDAQVEILNTVEETSQSFFDLILTHARQGFYGDPRHGGNRNMASWKMLGLPFPPVRGRQHYDEPKAG
jgi:gluconate 2-dehydrogenase gamma chain